MTGNQLVSAVGYFQASFPTLSQSLDHMKREDLTVKLTRSAFIWDEWGMRTSFICIDFLEIVAEDSAVMYSAYRDIPLGVICE